MSQINPGTNKVVNTIGVGNAPRGIAAGFGAIWVASEVDRRIARIDLTRGAVSKSIDLSADPTALATGAGALWVTSEDGGAVFRIDPQSGAVKPISVGRGPIGVAVAGGAVWVANRQDATVSRIDPATDSVTDLITRVGRDPSAIAADERGVWPTAGTGRWRGSIPRRDG